MALKCFLLSALLCTVSASLTWSNEAHARDEVPLECAQFETVHQMPATLSDLPITGIDCARAIIARASPEKREALFRKVSEAFTRWRLVEIPPPLHGAIEVFLIDYDQDHDWVLSFWRNAQTNSVSIRAFYKKPAEAAEDKANPFRPEFIASNADAAAFLRNRFGQDDQAISAALEAAGATRRPPHLIGKEKWVTYEIGAPDDITNLLTMGDKKMFYLKYRDEHFVGVFSEP